MWIVIKTVLFFGLGTYSVILHSTGPYYGLIKCTDTECMPFDSHQPDFYFKYKCDNIAKAMDGYDYGDNKNWEHKCVQMRSMRLWER